MSKALITLDTDEVWDIWYGMTRTRDYLIDKYGECAWADKVHALADKYGAMYDAMREEDMA